MAILKVVNETYETYNDLYNLIKYVLNPEKMDKKIFKYNLINPFTDYNKITQQFVDISNFYGKSFGTLAHHFVISYSGELRPYFLEKILKSIQLIISGDLVEYPLICALHDTSANDHFHLVIGSTSLYTGKKLTNNKEFQEALSYALTIYTQYEKDNRIYCMPHNVVYGRKA